MTYRSQDWRPATAEAYPNLASAVYLSRDEFLCHAADAYKAAQRQLLPPDGERWIDPECSLPWASAEGFYDGLLRQVAERLRRRALLTGHLVETLVEEDDDADAGAGQRPAAMAPVGAALAASAELGAGAGVDAPEVSA